MALRNANKNIQDLHIPTVNFTLRGFPVINFLKKVIFCYRATPGNLLMPNLKSRFILF